MKIASDPQQQLPHPSQCTGLPGLSTHVTGWVNHLKVPGSVELVTILLPPQNTIEFHTVSELIHTKLK